MKKTAFLAGISVAFMFAITSCESNKQACPTYTYHNSLPEKKKATKPGEQQPPKQTSKKPKSGVMPMVDKKHKQKVY